ncbi:hypothetical protein TKK_0012702 [Trichogramma kaykai]
MSKDKKIIGYSDISKENYDFTWVIKSYLLILEKGQGKIISPIFTIGNKNQTKFQLKLKKRKDTISTRVALYLLCVTTNAEITSSYKLSIFKDDEIVHSVMDSQTFREPSVKEIFDIQTYDMNKFISSTGTITIQYELTIATGNTQNFLNLESDNTNKVLVLKCNFNWLFLNKNFSDVILKTACGKEIPAHTGVLSIASSVFKDMFNRNMLENRSKSVNLIDVSYEAAVELLRYIYTGVVETQEFSLTSELLTAADEYQIEELKNECEEILISSLSIENVVKALKIADKCSVKHLKKEAVDFIKRNISGPLDYDDISNMILGKARLVAE